MTKLTLFGLISITMMLICYAFEQKSPWFILAFAGACLLSATYGFLQGAWPFGIAEVIWTGIALQRWWNVKRPL